MMCVVGGMGRAAPGNARDTFILQKDELIFRMSRVGGREGGREEGNGWIGSGAVFHEPFAKMINDLPSPSLLAV